jgi:hypothetical protein
MNYFNQSQPFLLINKKHKQENTTKISYNTKKVKINTYQPKQIKIATTTFTICKNTYLCKSLSGIIH